MVIKVRFPMLKEYLNTGGILRKLRFCSVSCVNKFRRKCHRPNKSKLGKLLWEMPTTKVATLYGVSDKAIEKWAKKLGVSKPRGYWMKVRKNKEETGPVAER